MFSRAEYIEEIKRLLYKADARTLVCVFAFLGGMEEESRETETV